MKTRSIPLAVATALLLSAVGLPTKAAVPQLSAVDGVLNAAGGAIVDGDYTMTFSLYADAKSTKATWSEVVKVAVVGGRFVHQLGSVTPLKPGLVDAAGASYLGLKVGSEPELPRQPVGATLFAFRASVADEAVTAKTADTAKALACTGCVSVKALKFDGDLDLGGNSLKAAKITATTVSASKVNAGVFVGDGSQLTGVLVKGGSCDSGKVVTGVKSDGTVTCGVGGGGGDLLGGKLSETFTEVAKTASLPAAIPDNTGTAASVQATYAKVGTANTIELKIALSNTDLSGVRIKVFPPYDKKVGIVVCDPCGAKAAKSYSASFTANSTFKSGSLKPALGKSLEGSWTLSVLDSSFCIPQAPGNAALCDTTKKVDGAVTAFTVSATVTSAQSVKLGGTLQLTKLVAPPFACEASREGHIYYDGTSRRLRFCDGNFWRSISDSCGNGILETGEQCDDGNNANEDGCSGECVLGGGLTNSDPASSCKTALQSAKLAGKTAKSGLYWLSLKGVSTEVYCDMTTTGGGWTLVAQRRGTNKNVEAFGGNLNGFFQAKGGSPKSLGHSSSYSMGVSNIPKRSEWLFVDIASGGGVDSDDAFIIGYEGNLFPNSTGATNISVKSVCNLTKTTCDTTSVYFKYLGSGHFSGSTCNNNQNGGGYGGNYGYCHNGLGSYSSNTLFGNRSAYGETKLWNYTDTGYRTRIFVR